MKTALLTEACVLRRRGYSFAQLSERLHISKSTASLWTRDVEMGELGKERLLKHRQISTQKSGDLSHQRKNGRLDKAAAEADRLFVSEKRESMIILAMLYECEGGKSAGGIRFTNSDPDVIKLFMTILRSCFSMDERRFHTLIHLHDYHDEVEICKYWSLVTSIPVAQFYKSFIKPSGHVYKKAGYMGCAHVYYNDAHIARVLRSFAKKLIKSYS